jgi:hypothetical protein
VTACSHSRTPQKAVRSQSLPKIGHELLKRLPREELREIVAEKDSVESVCGLASVSKPNVDVDLLVLGRVENVC